MPRLRSTLICLLLGLWAIQLCHAQQGLNNLWLMGYDSDAGLPWGGFDIEFITGERVITYHPRAIGYKTTAANLTTASGVVRSSANGTFVGNALGDTLLNGSGLAPSSYSSLYPEGLYVAQGALFLPDPVAQEIVHLFHGTVDVDPGGTALHFYHTAIDMNLDGGLGGVVVKNEALLNDMLQAGKITAVRHANGRDWWVFCHQANSNVFYRFLLSPSGVTLDGTQAIGIVRPPDAGQTCFSPDGSKFAYYWGETDLELFQFDRCSGLFSAPVFVPIDDTNTAGGVAFSPNSRFLYISSVLDLYQFDTEANDLAGSMVHIAVWDGFYSPQPPFGTYFLIAQTAPDGKIYISNGNGTFHLHVINSPDEPGAACDIQQHAVELPCYNVDALPNHPNYHLGPVLGSVCDSLGMGVAELRVPLAPVEASPNPSTGRVNLSYGAQREAGELQVLDAQGRLVLREKLPAWSTVHALDLLGEPAGMYHCRLQWGARSTSVRVILQP